jgi:hypothetical protein
MTRLRRHAPTACLLLLPAATSRAKNPWRRELQRVAVSVGRYSALRSRALPALVSRLLLDRRAATVLPRRQPARGRRRPAHQTAQGAFLQQRQQQLRRPVVAAALQRADQAGRRDQRRRGLGGRAAQGLPQCGGDNELIDVNPGPAGGPIRSPRAPPGHCGR